MPSLAEIDSVVLEKIFKLNVLVFLLFRSYLTLEKGWALHLNKIWTPLHKDTLCEVWLKLAKWFWRSFLNFVNVLGKGSDNTLESPSPNNVCNKFGWNWPMGSVFFILSMYFCLYKKNLNTHEFSSSEDALFKTDTVILENMKMWKVETAGRVVNGQQVKGKTSSKR